MLPAKQNRAVFVANQRLTVEDIQSLPNDGWHLFGRPAHNSKRAKRALLTLMRRGATVMVTAYADEVVEFQSLGIVYNVDVRVQITNP